MRHETATKCVRSADGAFMHRVNLAEVDLAVQEHAQIFVAWRARHHARHRVAVFGDGPQRAGHGLTASLGMSSSFRVIFRNHSSLSMLSTVVLEEAHRRAEASRAIELEMMLSSGARLGPDEIQSALGAGPI